MTNDEQLQYRITENLHEIAVCSRYVQRRLPMDQREFIDKLEALYKETANLRYLQLTGDTTETIFKS